MASENALSETNEDCDDVGGSYMISIHVSQHPAFLEEDGVTSTYAWNNAIGTSPSTTTDMSIAYFHGTTDITSTVDTYLFIVAGVSPCLSPSVIPTTLPVVGTACYTFQKQPAYVNDYTFTIKLSAVGATNSPVSNVF